MDDVIIVGGGAVGCATALVAARAGLRVRVVERTAPGSEASGAAAGILGAQPDSLTDGPLGRLCVAGRATYDTWAPRVVEETGMDVGFRPSGSLWVGVTAESVVAAERTAGWRRAAGQRVEVLDPKGVQRVEPELRSDAAGGVHLLDDARLDPPSFMRALEIACTRAGVSWLRGREARAVAISGDRVTGVTLDVGETLRAGNVVVCAGSWSSLLGGAGLAPSAVRPLRGQIIELRLPLRPIERPIFGPNCYLSPRDDGRVLVGSTKELAGYRKDVTAGAVAALLSAAVALCPALAGAVVGRLWAGLRPLSADDMPIIGPSHVTGLFAATGHGPNGMLLAPLTAEILGALITGQEPPMDIAPFAPSRPSVAQQQ